MAGEADLAYGRARGHLAPPQPDRSDQRSADGGFSGYCRPCPPRCDYPPLDDVAPLDITVAASVAAAIGDIRRSSDPQRFVAYLGLNPSVRQSGEAPAYHGRITKQGRGHARGMLVEAAWAAARSSGPLRAFYQRIAARRGKHIAAVATARKLARIIWHMLSKDADYIWARPALLARKLRTAELRGGLPTKHARRGAAYHFNIPAKRAEERSRVEKAEAAYTDLTARWRTRPNERAAVEKPIL
jgi:transposase